MSANLTNCEHMSANLTNCDHVSANLTNCDHVSANHTNCNHVSANLTNCDHVSANLTNCDHVSANCTNRRLRGKARAINRFGSFLKLSRFYNCLLSKFVYNKFAIFYPKLRKLED